MKVVNADSGMSYKSEPKVIAPHYSSQITGEGAREDTPCGQGGALQKSLQEHGQSPENTQPIKPTGSAVKAIAAKFEMVSQDPLFVPSPMRTINNRAAFNSRGILSQYTVNFSPTKLPISPESLSRGVKSDSAHSDHGISRATVLQEGCYAEYVRVMRGNEVGLMDTFMPEKTLDETMGKRREEAVSIAYDRKPSTSDDTATTHTTPRCREKKQSDAVALVERRPPSTPRPGTKTSLPENGGQLRAAHDSESLKKTAGKSDSGSQAPSPAAGHEAGCKHDHVTRAAMFDGARA